MSLPTELETAQGERGLTATSSFPFGSRRIGSDAPVFMIAELSGNHGGSYDRVMEMAALASESGADCVKVQTFTADTITLRSDRPEFQAKGIWAGRTLHDLYTEAAMPWEWQRDLMHECQRLGVEFFSSVFDPSSVEFLESIGVSGYKIASFELVDVGLIKAAAQTGKPLVMSTGMASLGEIDEAITAARDAGADDLVVLTCTSAYPAPASAANLKQIPHLMQTFDVVAGLSDHTMGNEVPIAATALGAKVIEKHFIGRRSDGGVDSSFSLEPADFRALTDAVRTTEQTLNPIEYGATDADRKSVSSRRSLYIVNDVEAGQVVETTDVRSVRPGAGLHPRHHDEIVGMVAAEDLVAGTPLSWHLVRPVDG